MSVTEELPTLHDVATTRVARRQGGSLLQFEITKKRVKRDHLMHFSRQLAVFVAAGIPILDALETITEEMSSKLLRAIVDDVMADLRSGATFAEAVAVHAEALPDYYIGILRAAELTGRLDVVLDQLADYIERDLEARRKVTSALAYPAVIMTASVAVILVLVFFVLPRFEAFFLSLDAELPLPTRILLAVTRFLTDNALALVGGAALILLSLAISQRTEPGRSARDRLLLRLPVVGDLVRHVVLERFCRILSALMVAGVPMTQALTVTMNATSNAVYKRGIATAHRAMLQGEGLAAPLIATGLFPPSAKQMFRVGEDTGTFDRQLETAGKYFARELEHRIKRFTTLFEPAVLLFVGLVVGFVAIALVSAMYGIFDAARPRS